MKSLILTTALLLAGGDAPTDWGAWERLELRARAAMFLSGSVEMRWGAAEGERQLTTETQARFLGATIARSSTLSRLDADDGRVIEYVDRQRDRARRYRFDNDGYTAEKLKPGDDPEAPLDAWRVVLSERYDYPLDDDGRPVEVRDYYSTLFRLDELPLERGGDSCTVWVATSDGPQPYRLSLGEPREVRLKLRLDGERKRRRVELRQLRLRVEAADPERASEKFLGMQGEVEMWVEADSKTLVEIVGKVPKVPGLVTLELAAFD